MIDVMRNLEYWQELMLTMKVDKKKLPAEEKKCFYCGAGPNHIRLLNPKGEFRGGVLNFSYRCDECKQYFKEYWINEEIKTLGGA